MAGKKSGKTTTRTSARGRSNSVGRATPGSRSRSSARSRSPSRVPSSVKKRSRTPASESKVRRRRSPSASSSPERAKPKRAVSKERRTAPVAVGDRITKSHNIQKETTPSRFSQRIIHRSENNHSSNTPILRSTSPSVRRTDSNCQLCERFCTFFRESVCPSPVVAAISLLTMLPIAFWLNLLVLAPASSKGGAPDDKSPGYRFAGVIWPTDIYAYFNIPCHLFVVAFLLLNLLPRFIPIGHRVSPVAESRRFDHRCNGFLALIFFCGLFATAQFCKWSPLSAFRPSMLLPKYHIQLLVAAGKIGSFLSVVAYIASRRIPRSQVNPEGNTGNFFVDFWAGRSLRPRWFGFDWKMFILQPAYIGFILVQLTYLCSQWEQFGRVSPALASMVAMHSLWMIDLLVNEQTMMSSFEVRREGFGYYQVAGVMITPFIYTIGATFLHSRPDEGRLYAADGRLDVMHCSMLAVSIILFLVGFWICRASNNQKHLFRHQPNHPAFANVDKISGPQSQRLLAGGWWGIVRHPNYLGEIIAAYATSLPAGFVSPIPWIYPIFLTCFMIHRIWRLEYLSAEKHGLSMAMYKKLVPCALIPKIY